MLVKAVEDLEQEATERVRLLEQKLKKTATAEIEVIYEFYLPIISFFSTVAAHSRNRLNVLIPKIILCIYYIPILCTLLLISLNVL